MLRRIHSQEDPESGQALAEFALVLPVLLLLLLGIADLSKAYNYWNDSTRLASATARYAAVQQHPTGLSLANLANYMKAQADSTELRNGVTVCITVPANVGGAVKVTVSSSYTFVPYLHLATATITGSADMRLEAVPKAPFPSTQCST